MVAGLAVLACLVAGLLFVSCFLLCGCVVAGWVAGWLVCYLADGTTSLGNSTNTDWVEFGPHFMGLKAHLLHGTTRLGTSTHFLG